MSIFVDRSEPWLVGMGLGMIHLTSLVEWEMLVFLDYVGAILYAGRARVFAFHELERGGMGGYRKGWFGWVVKEGVFAPLICSYLSLYVRGVS